jgi:hypothetical protein
VTFVHVAFIVVNMILSYEFGRTSLENRSAYGMLVWIELLKQSVEWDLLHVSHVYSLAQVNVSEGVDVHPLLV